MSNLREELTKLLSEVGVNINETNSIIEEYKLLLVVQECIIHNRYD